MSVSDRVPDRVSSVANSDPAMIVGLLAVVYAVYLIAGSIIGASPVGNMASLTRWIGLFALGALALNLHWGYTGLFNIGIVAFMGVGVHVTAIVSKQPVTEGGGPVVGATGGLGLPLPIGMLAARSPGRTGRPRPRRPASRSEAGGPARRSRRLSCRFPRSPAAWRRSPSRGRRRP